VKSFTLQSGAQTPAKLAKHIFDVIFATCGACGAAVPARLRRAPAARSARLRRVPTVMGTCARHACVGTCAAQRRF